MDDLVARRLHGVAIYPFSLDSFALAAFYGLVHKDYQWCSRRQEGNQQTKQDLGSKPAMPNRSVENPVIVREVAFVSEPEVRKAEETVRFPRARMAPTIRS